MSNYRRLISYIYAYEGEVKGKNIGFVKLESRGGQCKLSVNVKKVYVGGSDLGVYLLAPGKEISLGSIFIRSGAGEFRAVVSVDNVADSGVEMDSCYGLTIHEPSDGWRCYTTIWEDAVAHAAEVELAEVTSKSRRDTTDEEEIHKKAEAIAAEMDREIETVPEIAPGSNMAAAPETESAEEHVAAEAAWPQGDLEAEAVQSGERVQMVDGAETADVGEYAEDEDVTADAGEYADVEGMAADAEEYADVEGMTADAGEYAEAEGMAADAEEYADVEGMTADAGEYAEAGDMTADAEEHAEAEDLEAGAGEYADVEDTTADAEEHAEAEDMTAGAEEYTDVEGMTADAEEHAEVEDLETQAKGYAGAGGVAVDVKAEAIGYTEAEDAAAAKNAAEGLANASSQNCTGIGDEILSRRENTAGDMTSGPKAEDSQAENAFYRNGGGAGFNGEMTDVKETDINRKNVIPDGNQPGMSRVREAQGSWADSAKTRREPSESIPQQAFPGGSGDAMQQPAAQPARPDSVARRQERRIPGQTYPNTSMRNMPQQAKPATDIRRPPQQANPTTDIRRPPQQANPATDIRRMPQQTGPNTDIRRQPATAVPPMPWRQPADRPPQPRFMTNPARAAGDTAQQENEMSVQPVLRETPPYSRARPAQPQANQGQPDGQMNLSEQEQTHGTPDAVRPEASARPRPARPANQERNAMYRRQPIAQPPRSALNQSGSQMAQPANVLQPEAGSEQPVSKNMQQPAGTGSDSAAVPAVFSDSGSGVQEPVITGVDDDLILGDPQVLERLEEEERETMQPQQIWDAFRKRYPKIQAFECNGDCEILTIKPQDIGLLPRETWTYGNNSFLLHGYYNYRYLILAKVDTSNTGTRYLLGVPGNYYSNEKYMASMFGFPHFVLARKQPTGNGRFGYWYTDIRLENVN